ncbi:MAG TPA: hypothetical protein VJM33_08690 [Microthrixaceae bacterium]|nr:hypothetical protein [Microthrixaceae bacterium]
MGLLNGIREGIAGRLKQYKPEFGSAFLMYFDVQAHVGREFETNERYVLRRVVELDDPEIDRLPKWQRPLAREHLADESWIYVVATDTESGDMKVGHVWMTVTSVSGFGNGVMNVKLAPMEVYVFDLYIHPDHRRAALGNGLACWLVNNMGRVGYEWGYTHVLYDNAASVMWHHMFGFNWMQLFNYVHLGDRFWFKVPFSDSPRYGPLSRRGRHSDPDPQDPFGGAILPQEMIRAEQA